MRAIILAAGRGSRMGTLTDDRPKCLTKCAGRTLLEWQLKAIRSVGIHDIAVVRGYRAETINPPGCIWFENHNWSNTNMVSSMTCADKWLQHDDCIVSYSDIVYHPEILQRLSGHSGEIVVSYDEQWLSLWKERFENPLEDAETFRLRPNDTLESIGARAQSVNDIQGQYMGLLKISPSGWNRITNVLDDLPKDQSSQLDVTALLQLLLRSGIKIHTNPTKGRWCEVDTDNDLYLYENRLNRSNWTHDWRWEFEINA